MKNKSLLLLIFLSLLTPWATRAQSTHTFGEDATTYSHYYSPYGGYYGWQYEVLLYDADDVDFDGIVTAVSFKSNTYCDASDVAQWTIYMKDVPCFTTLDANTTFPSYIEGLTPVLPQTNMPELQIGWNQTQLTNNFVHQSGNSILVMVMATGCTSTGECNKPVYYKNTLKHVWALRRDNEAPDPNHIGSLVSYLPSISFTYTPSTPSCPSPSYIALNGSNALTTTSANIIWENVGQYYNIEYKQVTDETWIRRESNYNDNGVMLTGLTFSTNYQVRVQTVCNVDETSAWRGMSFSTPCDMISVTAGNHYVEDFEDYTATTAYLTIPTDYPNDMLPSCWKFLNRSETGYPKAYLTTYADWGFSDNYLVLSSSNTTPIYAILPKFENPTSGLRLTFSYRNESLGNSNGILHVGYMTDPTNATTYVNLYDYERTATKTTEIADFTGAPANSYIVFKYDGTSNNYFLGIDDVTVKPLPNCMEPTGLHIAEGSLTAHNVTMEWNLEEGVRYQYVMTYGITADPTTVDWDYPENILSWPSWNNLNANQDYTFYLRKWCNAEEQSDAVYISFHTPCNAIHYFPWEEGFQNYNANSIPDCWDNSASTSPTTTNSFGFVWGVYIPTNGNNKMLRMNNSSVQSGTALINSPMIALPSTGVYKFSFDYTHNATCGDFTVKISTDGGTTFTNLKSYAEGVGSSNTDPGTFTHDEITLEDYIGQTIMLQFYAYADYGNGAIFIDNLKIEELPVVDQWSDNFEGTECDWQFINGDRPNQWVWGNAAGNPGVSLYISNDGGTTNAYTVDEGNGSTVYAAKLLHFENTRYHFSYDYRVAGEVGYDFLRVALVPATVTLEASTLLPINNFKDQLPEGWIALDGGSQLSANSSNPSWLSKNVVVDIPTAGNYYLVLAWRNDYIDGNQTPAAVDNFTITRDLCPYDAGNLYANNVTTNSAWIYWTGDAPVWEIAYSTNQFSEYQSIFIGGNPEGNLYTMEGLDFGTEYQVKVRAFCDENHQGPWCDPISFTTDCPATYSVPFTEDFDSYPADVNNGLPRCWSYINTCSNSSYKIYPKIDHERPHSSANSLKFHSYYESESMSFDPQPQYAILPAVQNVSDLKLSLWSKAWYISSTYNGAFKVGVMTDPTDASTFTAVATFDPEDADYHEYTVDFSSYTGNGTYIAIMIDPATTIPNDGTHSTYNRIVFIDDVRVFSRYPVPIDLAASHITATSANITWTPGGDETVWQLAYKKTSDTEWTEVSGIDQAQYASSDLDTNTSYEVKVRAKIGDTYFNWTEPISFTTSYPTPFFEPFNIAELPADWGNYYVLADQVWAGTATLGGYGNWNFGNTNVFGEYHAKLNIWGGYSTNPTCSWLVTPNIYVEDGQFLSFDMALTFWNSDAPHNGTCDDDEFIVMASTDDGATWTELRKWDNAWYQHDYVYNDIPADGEKVYINLASYVGQSVRFAFYGESTESGNGDNDLHIDNVKVAYEQPCDMVDYFDVVSGSETPEGATFAWDDNGDDFTVMVGGPVSFTNLFACLFDGEEPPSELSHTGNYGFELANDGDRNCAKSSNGDVHNSTADMILEITSLEEAELSFDARVSSEEDYDKAYFSIDGVVQDNLNGISGDGEWYAYSYTLPAGTHTLRWYYTKDGSVDDHDDCFYVSDIVINSYIVANWTSYEHATSPFTVTGLSPETNYWAKAVRNCYTGEQSVDSYVASFWTTNPCQKPKNLEIYTGPYSAHLYWDYGYQEEEWTITWLNMTHQDQYGSITIHASQLSDPSQPEYFINGLESNADFIVAIEVPCDGIYTGEYEHQLVGSFTTAEQNSTQTTELVQGWNWWAPTVTRMARIDMEDELDPKLLHVIGQDGELGSYDELFPGQMYRVEVTEDCGFDFHDETATNKYVSIMPGQNWLGYFGAEKTITRVFLGFTPAAGDKVISQDEGFAIYNGTSWEGTLETLKPGKGYVYVSNASSAKTLHIE